MAVLSAFVKVCSSYTNAPTILFFQYLISCILTVPFALRASLKTQQKGLIALRSLFGVGEYVLLFFAIASIPLVDATLLLNTGPLFVPFVLLIWVKQKIPFKMWFPIILGFAGVFFVLHPGAEILQRGALFALLAGLSMACVMVSLRKLGGEPSLRVIFYYLFFGTIILLPYVIVTWHPIPWTIIGLMVLIGGIFSIVQYMFTLSFKYGCPSTLAPFSYTFILASGLLDWLFWHHIPTFMTWIGVVLIVGGGGLVLYLQKDT